MVRKITISIEEELYREIDRLRNRIPISHVCSEALRTALYELKEHGTVYPWLSALDSQEYDYPLLGEGDKYSY